MLASALKSPGAWLAILVGLAFTLMPSVGPFIAVLLLIGQPLKLTHQEIIWASALVFSGLPGLINDGLGGLVQAAGPVLAAWLVYRAFSMLPAIREDRRFRFLSIGLIVGMALTVFLGWFQNSTLDLAYRSFAEAISWETNPALYGHSVLVLGLAISLIVPFTWARIAALALAAFGILVSGSREAGLAWLVFALLMPLVDRHIRGGRRTVRYYGIIALLMVFLAGLGSLLGWGRVGFLVDVVPVPTTEKNLIQTSEIPESPD